MEIIKNRVEPANKTDNRIDPGMLQFSDEVIRLNILLGVQAEWIFDTNYKI